MSTSDKKLEQATKRLFDESVDGLDAATLSRLNRDRQAAIEAADRRWPQWLMWAPVTGIAAAVVAAVVLNDPTADETDSSFADLDIVLGEESIEMIEELEFYTWLDTVEEDES